MNDSNMHLKSCANAWLAMDKWFKDESENRQIELMEEVSRQLNEDGCNSAWIHRARFVEALFDKIDELEETVRDMSNKS